MRLSEIESAGTTVCLFRGMEDHGQVGNAALEQIAQAVGGKTFAGRDSVQAARYYQSRPNTRLIVVGYSLGAEGVLGMQALGPVLSITIAGWPTTLEQMAQAVQGTWHNFFQQKELDDILASRYKRGPYKPGGRAHSVDYGHSAIVGGVANQVIQLIKSQGSTDAGKPAGIKPQLSRADKLAQYNESQGRGKNFK
jgi:hypothetical protein